VLEEYLLSNVQRRELAQAGLEDLRRTAARQREIRPDEVDLTNIKGLFFVDAAYLGAARDQMSASYGSVEAFIREGVGWCDGDLARLRGHLLE
jgi:hypothetical protein